mmetsp:Transcript_129845/g.259012  ORF Transcript_129845/g.259012 Transcript_129845/m.259012 type:complete len:108 (+) Transcript_129845:163-486(+)
MLTRTEVCRSGLQGANVAVRPRFLWATVELLEHLGPGPERNCAGHEPGGTHNDHNHIYVDKDPDGDHHQAGQDGRDISVLLVAYAALGVREIFNRGAIQDEEKHLRM